MTRRTLVLLAALVAVGGLVAVRPGARPATSWVPELIVGLAYVASGIIVALADGRREGALIGAVAVAWWSFHLAPGARFVYVAVLVHAALAMPRGALTRRYDRIVVTVAYVATILLAVVPHRLSTVSWVALALTVAIAIAAATTGSARRVSSLLVTGLLAVNAAAHLVTGGTSDTVLLAVYEVGLCAVALGLAGAYSSWRRRPDVTDLVVELGPADALADLARRDPSIRDDPAFLAAVAAGDRLLAANAELRDELGLRISDLLSSRRRLVAAEDSERAALEERLQQGPAGRLAHIAARLASVSSTRPPAADALARARTLAISARSDLTGIARGLYPAAVVDGSLESALHDLATSSPIPVELDLQVTRVDPRAAANVYFVCAESVANAVKHSTARRVAISIRRRVSLTASDIIVTIVDDGRGGAAFATGTGLVGLADRLAAVGGTFNLSSPTGAGTRITVTVPEPGVVS
jgi:signal transduction histidine kinase